ncbi:O-antigen ligase [Microcystis aeruginosa]
MRNETKLLEVRIIRLAIYLLPFVGLAFNEAGFGFIQPALVPILIAFILSIFLRGFQFKRAFGKSRYINLIIFFLFLIIISTFLSFITDNFYTITKSLGVLISLLILFSVYYTVSWVTTSPATSKILAQDFVRVSVFVCFMVVLQLFIVSFTGRDYVAVTLASIARLLPYSVRVAAADEDYSLSLGEGRYSGVLTEPGDLGIFAMPAFAIICQMLFLGYLKKNNRIFATISLIIIVTSVILTYSTTNIFALSLLVAYFIFINQKWRIRKFSRQSLMQLWLTKVIPFLAITFFFVIVVFEYKKNIDQFNPIIGSRINQLEFFWSSGKITDPFALKDSEITNISVGTILNSYSTAIYALQKNPLLGIGLGNFAYAFQEAAPLKAGILARLNQHDGYSMLFRLIVETGLAGLIIFIYIFGSRASQIRDLIAESKLTANPYLRNVYEHWAKLGVAISLGAMAELAFVMLNRPSYWNIVLPLLFGICFKSNFFASIREREGIDNKTI